MSGLAPVDSADEARVKRKDFSFSFFVLELCTHKSLNILKLRALQADVFFQSLPVVARSSQPFSRL